MPPQHTRALLALLAALVAPSHGQTDVGCDPACPPRGYEADTSHLCPGDALDPFTAARRHGVCHPAKASKRYRDGLALESFRAPGRVTVLANYYTGCEAGRREAGVYAAVAQRIHDDTGGQVNFVTSLKGGGDCARWAGVYQDDARELGGARPSAMPLTVSDDSNDLRDRFFAPPYPHPSYVILDENLEVAYKSVGPCCGYESYFECTDRVAAGLDRMLTDAIYELYDRQGTNLFDGDDAGLADNGNDNDNDSNPIAPGMCKAKAYSKWSACSKTCGDGGIRFRHRANPERPAVSQPCPAWMTSTLPACEEQCVAELGGRRRVGVTVVAAGLSSPRDLAFHPTPGIHLGFASEGRPFNPLKGEELWVANGANHSISIVASLGTPHQTTIARRDRGYYHYMNNVTALAFNTVSNAPRNSDQDTFNYFAVCNDNRNDYIGAKEPNYFMGPTLYDTDTVGKPGRKNTVTRAGADCRDPADQCFFLHADMLHEAPACLGLAHDPEVETAYGAVYWAFDATGDNGGDGGQLVRFDFSQPHGPGSMDHSIATVRRYPEVKLYRSKSRAGPEGYHAGMVIHPETRVLYAANPGKGTIVAVRIDTGRYSRTAREEYPIFSNRLPSFEYSIYECVEQEVFATGLDHPSGLALSRDGTMLFVAETGGLIIAYELESGVALRSVDLAPLGYTSIGGLAVSPATGHLYFADMDTNQVARIDAQSGGRNCKYQSRVNSKFRSALEKAKVQVESECGVTFSLARDYSCQVDGTIPSGTLFEQVHTDTGYASDNPNVQAMAGMDAAAALLANRTDCEYNSPLNLDALLLGGYYCHACLPRNRGASCDAGGTCSNVQWQGFTCDNEYYVDLDDKSVDGPSLVVSSLHYQTTYPKDTTFSLLRGVTYRFTIRTGAEQPVFVGTVPDFLSSIPVVMLKSLPSQSGVTSGPLLLTVDETTPDCLYLATPLTESITLAVGDTPECAPARNRPTRPPTPKPRNRPTRPPARAPVTADGVCLTEAACEEASKGYDSFTTGQFATNTKGCFAKKNNAYFTRGTPAEMAVMELPGAQERIRCDAVAIEGETVSPVRPPSSDGVACLTEEACRVMSSRLGFASLTLGDYATKGCFAKKNKAYFSPGSEEEMSKTDLPGVQARIQCTATRACRTAGECRARSGGARFEQGVYATKGCFEKKGVVYFAPGTDAEMAATDLPGVQERVWCDGVPANEAAPTLTRASAVKELSESGREFAGSGSTRRITSHPIYTAIAAIAVTCLVI